MKKSVTVHYRRLDRESSDFPSETLEEVLRTAFAAVPSTIGAKIVASAVFLDLGIADSITDKHRKYPSSFVIPIKAE